MIKIEHVSKSFGEHVVLRDVSFTLPSEGVTCLMAPSGAGKTTLARILLGLESADIGTITGVPTRRAAVFQEDRLCEFLTVSKNIRLAAPQTTSAQVAEHLKYVGMDGFATARAGTLSGGQKRRAAIVRAVLANAPFLVLDEPFAGLDDDARRDVIGYLHTFAAGSCVLLITHDRRDADSFAAQIITL